MTLSKCRRLHSTQQRNQWPHGIHGGYQHPRGISTTLPEFMIPPQFALQLCTTWSRGGGGQSNHTLGAGFKHGLQSPASSPSVTSAWPECITGTALQLRWSMMEAPPRSGGPISAPTFQAILSSMPLALSLPVPLLAKGDWQRDKANYRKKDTHSFPGVPHRWKAHPP